MRWPLRALLLALLMVAGQVAARTSEPLPFANHAELTRFQRLTRQFGCSVCHNASLADADADLAHDLRREVFQRMRSGSSDARITEDLVDRYSPVLHYQPTAQPALSLLWFTPIITLLLGATLLVLAEHRRHHRDDWR